MSTSKFLAHSAALFWALRSWVHPFLSYPAEGRKAKRMCDAAAHC